LKIVFWLHADFSIFGFKIGNYLAQFALYFVTVQYIRWIAILQHWIPAFAGMTHPDKPFPGSSCRRKSARSAIQVFLMIVLNCYQDCKPKINERSLPQAAGAMHPRLCRFRHLAALSFPTSTFWHYMLKCNAFAHLTRFWAPVVWFFSEMPGSPLFLKKMATT